MRIQISDDRPVRVLLAIASGAALGLAFPGYNLSLFAWLAVGLLLLASAGAGRLESLLYGFLHGVVFYPVVLTWVAAVLHRYGHLSWWTATGLVGLIGIVGGVVSSVFSASVAFVSRKENGLACLLAPFLWVALEFARTHLPFIGFPWNLTGYAASGNLALLQLTTVTGIYGLTFLIAAYSSLLTYALLTGTRSPRTAAIVVTGVLLLLAEGGKYLVPRTTPHFAAHLVQTNFPQSERYPANWLELHAADLGELERISIDGAKGSPGLVVWPEVPAPFSLQEPQFEQRALRVAHDSASDFLVGVVDWKRSASGIWQASNSAALLDPAGQRIFIYDKIHLVPFGEYVPLRRWITFAGRLTADVSDFTPGTEYRVGRLPLTQTPFPSPERKFAVFICYEAIFPSEVRRFVANGAQLLMNISNDGWFGRSAAPEQHLMMARVRAVENRRWLLRDTNNGYTVSIDPYGRIVALLSTDVRGQLSAPYDFRTDLTLYSRFGDWFAWLCVFFSAGMLALYSKSICGTKEAAI